MNNKFYNAIENRDAAALATIANSGRQQHDNVVNITAERLVDAFFEQLLKQVFPAAEQTSLKTKAHETAAKRQWIAAFAENGIRTREQLSAGMRKGPLQRFAFLALYGTIRILVQKLCNCARCECR